MQGAIKIGTPLSQTAKKVLFCGGGELGKEVVIELQRLGVEVIVIDRYAHAPAMHVAHRCHVLPMLDAHALRSIIEIEKPDIIVPEIEAIATEVLLDLERNGYTVIPSAHAVHVTMNRERTRTLAAQQLKLKTSAYRFAQTYDEFVTAVKEIGLPCVVKPNMSSSGKGQSVVKTPQDIKKAWEYAQKGTRGNADKVIVEAFIDFDFEITLLTVRDSEGNTHFCNPIGHTQIDGDYQESWQPQPMSEIALKNAQEIAHKITNALGGRGIFGVELFIKGDEVYFSEVSPRPHDTGMVTLISQNLSEFALHARAMLGLPITQIKQHQPSASHTLLVTGTSRNVQFCNLDQALAQSDTQLRLFGKPEVDGKRRMGVTLASGDDTKQARGKARACVKSIKVIL